MKSAIHKHRLAGACAAMLCLAAPWPALANQASLHLAIGDPARSGQELPLVLDGIRDTARGDLVTPAEMAARMAGRSAASSGKLR